MKRNIGKFAANIAAAGMLLGAAVVWADDQTPQSSSSSTDQSQQAGQAGQSSTSSSAQQAGQSGTSSSSGQFGVGTSSSTTDAAGAQTPGEKVGEKIDAAIGQVASDPQQFIKTAYQENLFEVKAGQLAQQKAQGQQTKDFAQTLVQDHQQSIDQLKKLADQKNVQVTDQLDSRRQRMLDELSSLSGQDFDKRFMNQQVRMHRRAIAIYQQAAEKNTDSEVKQFAQQNIASLQHHLQMAQQQGGISEPAGAGQSQDQGSSSQGQQGLGSSSSSSSSQDQSGQSQSGQSGQAGQSGQSGQPAQPSNP